MGVRQRSLVLGGVALAVSVAGGCSDGASSGRDDSTSTTSMRTVEVDDLAPRYRAALAWTGREVLVVGGGRDPEFDEDLVEGGILVAPELSSARVLPEDPFDGPLYGPAVVVVGYEAIVVGQECREQTPVEDSGTTRCDPGTLAAAVYDLRTSIWRPIEVPAGLAYDQTPEGGPVGVPASSTAIGSTGDGRAVFRIGPRGDRYWVFDPRASAGPTWERIPDPPVAPTDPYLLDAGFPTAVIDECLSGDHLIAIEAVTPVEPQTVPAADDGVRTHVLDLAAGGTWTEAAVLDEQLDQPFLTCTDGGALMTGGWSVVADAIWDQTPGVWMFDIASGAWRATAAPPPAPPAPLTARVWTGSEVVFVPSDDIEGLAYSPSTDTWRPTSASGAEIFRGRAIAAGDDIVGIASSDRGDVPAGGLFSFVP